MNSSNTSNNVIYHADGSIQTFEYSEEYDAYYILETGEWVDSKCHDPTCEFCVGRPERFPI